MVAGVLPEILPGTPSDQFVAESIAGLHSLMIGACIPDSKQQNLKADLEDLGAIAVQELTKEDWESLPCWKNLRPLQQRRLLQQVLGPRSA